MKKNGTHLTIFVYYLLWELNRKKLTAQQTIHHCTVAREVKVWSIEAARVTLNSNSLIVPNQVEENITALTRNALIELVPDSVVHHNVKLEQKNLLIFETGEIGSKPYTLKLTIKKALEN